MTITRRRKSRLHETCAPSDLAFLLIIYFLVIAGFNVNMGFLVNLPESDSVLFVPQEYLMRFDMDSTGTVFYRGVALNIPAAQQQIRAAIASNPDMAVALAIDGKAPWQQVVQFVELAQNLQVQTFSFSMREEL
ncbi:MAG: biopolymer transporter ExbD [Treponema sp.]|nr:biopolymer transporter ExbD [Treponema sp.]